MMYDKSKPKYEWGDGWHSKTISDKQADYLKILADQSGYKIRFDKLDRGTASFLIDDFLRGPSLTHGLFKRDWVNTDIVIPITHLLRKEISWWMNIDRVEVDLDKMNIEQLLAIARKMGIQGICEQLLNSN